MSKEKLDKEQESGSTEPEKQDETALADSDIQEPSQELPDAENPGEDDEFEDEPDGGNASVTSPDSPGEKGTELHASVTSPEEKPTPTTEDFKRAENPEVKAKGYYRALNVRERDMLFAIYEKWNGNLSEMILDKDCIFKAYSQIHYYSKLYYFKERLIEKKRENAERTMSMLKDAKHLAIQNAIRLLEKRHRLVFNRYGVQLFDTEGNPLIVEQLPYYKEIKAAWEIIKTELGEATAIAKQDVTSGGKPIQGNTIVFKSFKENAPSS